MCANGYIMQNLKEITPVECPCGWSRRAFALPENKVATLHMVDISVDARTHYHKKLTEIYYILETDGEAFLELDGQLVPVQPGSAILIHSGTRHRAVGKLKIMNLVVPPFDPQDEWFD